MRGQNKNNVEKISRRRGQMIDGKEVITVYKQVKKKGVSHSINIKSIKKLGPYHEKGMEEVIEVTLKDKTSFQVKVNHYGRIIHPGKNKKERPLVKRVHKGSYLEEVLYTIEGVPGIKGSDDRIKFTASGGYPSSGSASLKYEIT